MGALLQFHHPGGAPRLDEALSAFGLDRADVDAEFGVVATDPRADLFVIRVEDRALEEVRAALARRPSRPGEGLFGDPRVEPTGPAGGS
jgi:hypothetical protein